VPTNKPKLNKERMKKQKKIKIYKDGKLLVNKKDYYLFENSIWFVQKPRKRKVIKINYFHSIDELDHYYDQQTKTK
jgi:hypothetical protein